jgi:hypothetical protein
MGDPLQFNPALIWLQFGNYSMALCRTNEKHSRKWIESHGVDTTYSSEI